MNSMNKILALTFKHDEPRRTRVLAQNSVVLAMAFRSELHMTEGEFSPGELCGLIGNLDVDLAVMDFNAAEDLPGSGISPRVQFLENCDVPVMIIPAGMELGVPPVQWFLVPMSGEKRSSEALKTALELAEDLEAPVDLVHVTRIGERCTCEAAFLESGGDHVYHEYARMLEKIVAEGSPLSSLQQRKRVRKFFHRLGDITGEIAGLASSHGGCLVVLEWSGTFVKGHAGNLKSLLHTFNFPVLFTKVKRKPEFRLKVAASLS